MKYINLLFQLSCKHDIRANLQLLVSVIGAANISFDSTKTDDSFANEDHDSVSLAGAYGG